ncbi:MULTISPECIES: DUF6058 family natural product biosynthesis protein [Pseudoalteromonas]|uniref:Orphan protein n=1 Tax=Pseudoalteromonas amylolytica TaxID=1859457 RepID=A0A1S1MMT5_9GAMM|nr:MULTISPECIES: DUF6058 family natural product biosynthesis protein [Pseudoalteromonas]OHU86180.1 hypothetical protein BFC16_15860 [Pseudoalteromonas sp. JW3]OHU89713.1 hypothetical protein BET10_16455 [Pseudoalteromonas amylolytica]
MELIKYLNEFFITKSELLTQSQVSEQVLAHYQETGVMPQCSYKLKLALESNSFFGLHEDTQEIEYYAKGYFAWLGIVQSLEDKEKIYSVFSKRYRKALEQLKSQGFTSTNVKLNADVQSHIEQEWVHFLDGVYGLCTKSGLPEHIAAKELAIAQINELSELESPTASQLSQLKRAIDLLDESSTLFAPHERAKSSRHRLIDEMKRKYQF